MGNICDCLTPATIAEPEYTPVETTEIVQPKPRPVERSTNNYQSILETASGNFISSKYRTRSEGVAITSGGSEGAESVRSRFTKAEVNPQVVCSPPSTGIVLQSYSTFTSQGAAKSNGQSDSTKESNGMNGASGGAISALHVKPYQDTALEGAADSLAQLVVKQTERSIDKFSSNPNECSAVVGFKPFEIASISAR